MRYALLCRMGAAINVVFLVLSGSLAAYVFYGFISVSPDIDQQDEVFWIFSKRVYTRGLAIFGEYLMHGDRLSNARTLAASSVLTLGQPVRWDKVQVDDAVFDGVPVRIYRPETRVSNSPALVWLHGGGWVTNRAKNDDFFMAELVRRLGIVFVSVDYRLAPEHPYPTPFEDCERATAFFLENAGKYGVDPERVALAGASAGGNLAAAVALKFRDDKRKFRLRLQVLIVPCLQAFDFNTPSYQENEGDAYLPKYWMIHFWLWYGFGQNSLNLTHEFGSNMHTTAQAKLSKYGQYTHHDLVPKKLLTSFYRPSDTNYGNAELWTKVEPVVADPYFAPLMAENLRNLPKAYIATARYDVLRDDGIMYSKRLEAARVDVTLQNYDKGFHAMAVFIDKLDLSKQVLNDLVKYLQQNL